MNVGACADVRLERPTDPPTRRRTDEGGREAAAFAQVMAGALDAQAPPREERWETRSLGPDERAASAGGRLDPADGRVDERAHGRTEGRTDGRVLRTDGQDDGQTGRRAAPTDGRAGRTDDGDGRLEAGPIAPGNAAGEKDRAAGRAQDTASRGETPARAGKRGVNGAHAPTAAPSPAKAAAATRAVVDDETLRTLARRGGVATPVGAARREDGVNTAAPGQPATLPGARAGEDDAASAGATTARPASPATAAAKKAANRFEATLAGAGSAANRQGRQPVADGVGARPGAATAAGPPVAAPAHDPGFGTSATGAAAAAARASAAPAPAQAPAAWAQALERTTVLADRGGGRADVSLQPAALGRVDLRVQVVEGQVRVTMVAERPEAAFLLQKEAHQLAQALVDRGFGDPQVSVENGTAGGAAGRDGAADGRGGNERSEAGEAAASGEPSSPRRPIALSAAPRLHRGVLDVVA